MVTEKSESMMDTVDHGHLDPLTVFDVVHNGREVLEGIEYEIEKLTEKKRRIEGNLDCLGTVITHAPHNHDHLPNEILSRVFSLIAQDYGSVQFSGFKLRRPPQLSISHACSHWRKVALSTPELWSNTWLDVETADDASICLHQRWLLRAGTFPVTLSIYFDYSQDGDEVASTLQRILLPFRVKKLDIRLNYEQFEALSTLPKTVLSDFAVLGLNIYLPDEEESININPHHFVTQLQSLTLYGDRLDVWVVKASTVLPWSQLRSLDVEGIDIANIHTIVDILRQTPLLQKLNLKINRFDFDAVEDLTMPHLRSLQLQIFMANDNGTGLDKVLRIFTCPSLISFTLSSSILWTGETFEILKQQYNMQNLEAVEFGRGGFALPISSILWNAPMLRSLAVPWPAVLDDDTITGISNGTLGQSLRKLEINNACDVEDVFNMVEARKKTVDRMIEKGCSWREDITVLNYVLLRLPEGGSEQKDKYQHRVDVLQEVGITFIMWLAYSYTLSVEGRNL